MVYNICVNESINPKSRFEMLYRYLRYRSCWQRALFHIFEPAGFAGGHFWIVFFENFTHSKRNLHRTTYWQQSHLH